MATMLISRNDEMRMSQRLTLQHPKEFLFSKWFVDTSTISRDRLKTTVMQIKTFEYGEGSKYTIEGGYKGFASKIGHTSFTYDFEYGFKDEIDGSTLGDAGLTATEFAGMIGQTHSINYNDKMTRRVIHCIGQGAGNKVNIPNANYNAINVFNGIKQALATMYAVDVNKMADWSIDCTDITLMISYTTNNLLLKAYEERAIAEIQNSVTIKNGKFTSFYGMPVIVIYDSFFIDKYDWKSVVLDGVTDMAYRPSADANNIAFALVTHNTPNRPIMIIDNYRVKVKHQECSHKDGYENVGHIHAGAQVIEPNKKGIYVAVISDTAPAQAEYSLGVEKPVAEQKKTSGVI